MVGQGGQVYRLVMMVIRSTWMAPQLLPLVLSGKAGFNLGIDSDGEAAEGITVSPV